MGRARRGDRVREELASRLVAGVAEELGREVSLRLPLSGNTVYSSDQVQEGLVSRLVAAVAEELGREVSLRLPPQRESARLARGYNSRRQMQMKSASRKAICSSSQPRRPFS